VFLFHIIATRNFDLRLRMKESAVKTGESRDYIFLSIDRSEYSNLYDYMVSKEITVNNPKLTAAAGAGEMDLGMDDDEEESEDEDYKAPAESDSDGGGSDDDDDENSDGGGSHKEESQQPKKKEKAVAAPKKKEAVKPAKETKESKVRNMILIKLNKNVNTY
jgi:hypothetical protein